MQSGSDGDRNDAEALATLAASLKGVDVELDVETCDGRRHRGRRLQNVTIEPARDLVSGWDPVAGAVRSFRLSRVSRMLAAPPVPPRVTVVDGIVTDDEPVLYGTRSRAAEAVLGRLRGGRSYEAQRMPVEGGGAFARPLVASAEAEPPPSALAAFVAGDCDGVSIEDTGIGVAVARLTEREVL